MACLGAGLVFAFGGVLVNLRVFNMVVGGTSLVDQLLH